MRSSDREGLPTREQLLRTGESIAAAQEADGAIPWYPGGHTDPWDHVESAMALDVVGLHDHARAAYEWLARTQRGDGSWPARVEVGVATEHHVESNFCAYPAVGVWHHVLATGRADAHRWFPMVRRALDLVIDMQLPGGEVAWARGEGGIADEALLTSSSSIYQALRAGIALATEVGESVPDWELAAGLLGHAIAAHPERFADRDRYSMDWYYPVLGGALRGPVATRRVEDQWDRFVVEGLGIRCVSDRPWVTGAETCELALALDALGQQDLATRLVGDMQHLRERDGSYWTGYVYTDDARWPVERSTWTGAAVVLAVDALVPTSAASGIFRDDALPLGVHPDDVVCEVDPACRSLTTEGAAHGSHG